MIALAVVTALALAASPAPAGGLRTITVTATDDKGAPVTGLLASEVALEQGGVALPVTELVYESRPLTLALIVDTSEPLGSAFRLHYVPAVAAFVAGLPEGTRYVLWTTGDRPTRLVDYTTDRAQAGRALARAPLTGGNRVFDALVEASGDLRRREGERAAVVVVTGTGTAFTDYDRRTVVDRCLGGGTVFSTVRVDEGSAPVQAEPGTVTSADYEYVLGSLPERSGGRREILLSPMGLEAALAKVRADLGGQYRLTYAAPARDGRLKATVARPGVRLQVGQPR